MKTTFSNEASRPIPRKAARNNNNEATKYIPECTIHLVTDNNDQDGPDCKYLSVKRSLPVTAGDNDGSKYKSTSFGLTKERQNNGSTSSTNGKKSRHNSVSRQDLSCTTTLRLSYTEMLQANGMLW